jgi:hypothetical protein
VSDWDTVRELGLHLPDVEEGTSYGTPALKVAGRMFVRLRPEADEQVLVLRIERPSSPTCPPSRLFTAPKRLAAAYERSESGP